MPQRVEPVLARELRAVAAGDDDARPVGASAPPRARARRGSCARSARRRRGRRAARARARGARGAASASGVNARVDAARDHGDALRRERRAARRARRARTRIRSRRAARDGPAPAAAAAARRRRRASTSPGGAAPRRRGSRPRCAGTRAARGWPGTAARARARGARRQHDLLPRVAGAVGEPRPRREHRVARRGAARAAGPRARAPSARRRRARGARRRGRRWRCGDRAAGVRVGVDGRSLVGGGARGVAHYTAALLEALAARVPGRRVPRAAAARSRRRCPRGVRGGPVTRCRRARCSAPRRWPAGRASTALLGAGCDVVWAPAPGAAGGRRRAVRAHRPRPLVGAAPAATSRRYERAWHALARPRPPGPRGPARVLTRHARRCASDLIARVGADPRRACAPCRWPRRPVAPADGRARAPRTSSSSARSSPARRRTSWSTPSSAPGRAGSRPSSWSSGRAGSTRAGRACGGSGGSTTSARSTPARSRSCCRRGSRASGSRRSRASRPARPRSSPTSRCSARCSGEGALYVPPGDAEALADALLSRRARPGAPRAACSPPAAPGSPRSPGPRPPGATRAVLAEAA